MEPIQQLQRWQEQLQTAPSGAVGDLLVCDRLIKHGMQTLERIAALERDLAAAQAVLPCGHHNSLMLKSAETGEPLYCELCDCISRRNDAEKMEAEARAAWSYATTLAVSMHRQHYAEDSPNWQPLTDLVGLLTQIDNMYAGLRNDLEAAEVENKRLVGLPLATLMVERDELRSCLSRAIEMSEEAWSDLTYRERAMLKPTIDQWRKAVVGK